MTQSNKIQFEKFISHSLTGNYFIKELLLLGFVYKKLPVRNKL